MDFQKSKCLVDSVKTKPKNGFFLLVNMKLRSFAHNELFKIHFNQEVTCLM